MLNIVIYYDLLRNGVYETGSTDHKLIMEVIDPSGKSIEKILTLGTDLTVGNNRSNFMNLNTNLSKIINSGTVRITLYDRPLSRKWSLTLRIFR